MSKKFQGDIFKLVALSDQKFKTQGYLSYHDIGQIKAANSYFSEPTK